MLGLRRLDYHASEHVVAVQKEEKDETADEKDRAADEEGCGGEDQRHGVGGHARFGEAAAFLAAHKNQKLEKRKFFTKIS